MLRLPAFKFGWRVRLSLTFALGALVLSTVLSLLTWEATAEILVSQKVDEAVDDALRNAVTVRNNLTSDTKLDELLSSLSNQDRSLPIVHFNDRWGALDTLTFSQDDLPADLTTMVMRGESGHVTFRNRQGEMMLVVGVPIPARQAQYFEGVPFGETERALSGLARSLAFASVITTALAAFVGFWFSRRALRPLLDLGRASEAITRGRFETRIEVSGDPELRVLTTTFNEMASALQDRIERDARFASEVSHELRSPLMTLAAAVEVLQNSRDEMSERAQTALDLLAAEVDRFQLFVDDLLEVSRFDVASVRVNLEEVNLAALVIAAVNSAGVGTIPISYEEGIGDLVMNIDKRRFSRIIANLLDNAKKYAGGATRVEVSLVPARDEPDTPAVPPPVSGMQPTAESTGPWVRIAVEDEGNGVPEDEREIIFDRFSRGSESGKRASDSGVGLGLALVDEHVKLHGGRVWVEDRPDGVSGARFVVELPIDVEQHDGVDEAP